MGFTSPKQEKRSQFSKFSNSKILTIHFFFPKKTNRKNTHPKTPQQNGMELGRLSPAIAIGFLGGGTPNQKFTGKLSVKNFQGIIHRYR